MKKSELTEMVRKIVREEKTLKEQTYSPMTPQQKIAQRQLAIAKQSAANADAIAARKELMNINKQ
jgi:hypothetical protein